MPKLLIADHSELRSDRLKEALQTEWEIHTCTDSYPVIDTMRYINPDAMIVDLNIGPQNGLSVLQEGFPDLPPVILALTNFISPYVAQTAESLGVGSLMRIPCKIDHIKERLTDMYQSHSIKPTMLTRHLDALAIGKNLTGYRCLLAVIPFFKSDANFMLKEVYPDVAKLCGLNDDRCVEHAIRTAIRDAWERRDPAVWSYYFPNHTHCPSNKEFIARIAELI